MRAEGEGEVFSKAYCWHVKCSLTTAELAVGCTEVHGVAKLVMLRERGCDDLGVYGGKAGIEEWPKLVGWRHSENYKSVWVFNSESDGTYWDGETPQKEDMSLTTLLEGDPLVYAVLDTREARAFIVKHYDQHGNIRPEYREVSNV
jgi:hypothetical protein